MKNLVKFLASPLINRLHDLNARTYTLETALYTLIEQPVYATADAEVKAFNGQKGRQHIFKELIELYPFEQVVETGTWLGTTTGYMAEMTGLPVYTSEINPTLHALAKKRLANVPRVTCLLGDSREALRWLIAQNRTAQRTLFYLDAHWYASLPLQEELEIIARHWKNYVILIDDFQVPNDRGYGYDNYGWNKALSLAYLKKVPVRHQFAAFFPKLPSQQETGAKRGCLVLTPSTEATLLQQKSRTLVHYT